MEQLFFTVVMILGLTVILGIIGVSAYELIKTTKYKNRLKVGDWVTYTKVSLSEENKTITNNGIGMISNDLGNGYLLNSSKEVFQYTELKRIKTEVVK